MESLTQEEYAFLKTYEDRLNTASKSQYVRAIPSGDIHKMRLIYSRLIGKSYSMNESCGGCILTLCRKLKPIYDEYTVKRNSTGQGTEENEDSANAFGGEIKNSNTKES